MKKKKIGIIFECFRNCSIIHDFHYLFLQYYKEHEMDIYQIWTKYNKPWSKFEIACFSVALIIIFICTSYCVYKKKINKIQATAILLMVVFLSIVFESTIFTRTVTVRRYELQLFWSWREIISYHIIPSSYCFYK